jgi:hypothetical protein
MAASKAIKAANAKAARIAKARLTLWEEIPGLRTGDFFERPALSYSEGGGWGVLEVTVALRSCMSLHQQGEMPRDFLIDLIRVTLRPARCGVESSRRALLGVAPVRLRLVGFSRAH